MQKPRSTFLDFIAGEGSAAEAHHLQLSQDEADVRVGALHQGLQRGLIHLQALFLADLHHALGDLLPGGLPASHYADFEHGKMMYVYTRQLGI